MPGSTPDRGHADNAHTLEVSDNGPVMAFDFGERRIGVAVGDLQLGIAHPLETVYCKPGQNPLDLISGLIAEWKPRLFVVGLPVSEDGKPHSLAPTVQRFCEALERRFKIATQLVDERFTSAEASGMLREAGIRGRKQKEFLDQLAAQTILEDYFARRQANQYARNTA